VLAKAGVVDSGGKGLFYILEGMLRGLRGETLELSSDQEASPQVAEIVLDPHNLPSVRYGFDVQFLIWGRGLDVDAIRNRIAEMGDCPLVEGTATMVKVHIHVFDPSVPLAYGVSQGLLTDIVVENMDAMAAMGNVPDDVKDLLSVAPLPTYELSEVLGEVGILAVSSGPGLHQVFESLGVSAVVSGGQTMNPSTQELLDAIEALPTEEVIVLPNNSNIILAAQQARQLSRKRVEVVPSRTLPQGISAVLAFNWQSGLEENLASMERALANVDTGEVTVAVRDANIDGIDVRVHDVVGLLNGLLTTKGESPEEVVMMLLSQMDAHMSENITLFWGESVDPEQAKALGAEVMAAYPDQAVEVVNGGQPHYHYIVSTE
jgi:DAK2 domain fusion protein YloV